MKKNREAFLHKSHPILCSNKQKAEYSNGVGHDRHG